MAYKLGMFISSFIERYKTTKTEEKDVTTKEFTKDDLLEACFQVVESHDYDEASRREVPWGTTFHGYCSIIYDIKRNKEIIFTLIDEQEYSNRASCYITEKYKITGFNKKEYEYPIRSMGRSIMCKAKKMCKILDDRDDLLKQKREENISEKIEEERKYQQDLNNAVMLVKGHKR